MIAIIQRCQESAGEYIHLMGWGGDESRARINAQTWVEKGANEFDREFKGGEAIRMTPALGAALEREFYSWPMSHLRTTKQGRLTATRKALRRSRG